MSEPSAPIVPTPSKRTLKQRLAAHYDEYGHVAIVTYVTLSLLTIIGFSVAIGAGTSPESTAGVFGVVVAGWAAAKVTLPIRILITLALTPVVATVVKQLRRKRPVTETDNAVPPRPPPPSEPPP